MRVLTYNCCGLPIWTGDIAERFEQIGAAIAALAPTVVVLQEVFFQAHLDVLCRRLPGYHVLFREHGRLGIRGGLVIFSRAPLLAPRFVPFRRQGSLLRYTALARISCKGLLTASLELESGSPVSLVATHPVADYRSWRSIERPTDRGERSALQYLWKLGAVARGDPYPELQAAQLGQLAEHVRGLPADGTVVVAGDLNVTPDSPHLAELLERAQLEDSMAGSLVPSLIDEPYYRLPFHGAPRLRLDYVLVRRARPGRLQPTGSRYVLDEARRLSSGQSRTLSDHLGVLAAFEPVSRGETGP